MVQIEACQAKGDIQCVRDAQAPTMQRKIRELRFAIAMEKKFSKDEILRYLNIAYYGQGVRRRGSGPALLLHESL